MIAPLGIARPSVTGGGDWRMLAIDAIPFKSTEVADGVGWLMTVPWLWIEDAEGARLCLARYEEDLGKDGRSAVAWKDDLLLRSGDVGAEEAGERWEGGV